MRKLVMNDLRMGVFVVALGVFAGLLVPAQQAFAQFEEPQIRKIDQSERDRFEQRFENIKWTGQGLYNPTVIDRIPTMELRSRIQAVFGDPTQKIEQLFGKKNYRPGKAIQFEYWFVVDGEMPLMVLDLDGPFENGLVYVGASQFIDRMPQVKRTFTKMLMEEGLEFAPYSDYFFSPEREQWYEVRYDGVDFTREALKKAPVFR
ncbi:MAG: hypothetical protein ACO363_00865 [Balneolaceae bacterium]|jgi:hypothetical protein